MLMREVMPRGTFGLAPPGSLAAAAAFGCQLVFMRLSASGGVRPAAMSGSQRTCRVMTAWIQRSSAAAQAVRACWRASRLSSRVVTWVNLAAMTGLLGSAAHTARHAATRSAGRPRLETEVLP